MVHCFRVVLLILMLSLLFEQDGEAQVWTSIGPTNAAIGRVASIAVDPTDQSHWLIGAGNGGVWETRDAGASFLPLSDA